MPTRRRPAALLLAALAAMLLTWVVREVNHTRIGHEPRPQDRSRWFSSDPDGHYHMRRLERLMEEGFPVAETDPFLSFPEGARIPWPPYYTYVAWALLAPGAPAEPQARSLHVEHGVAALPSCFAVLTALAVVLAAGRLAGAPGALVAGLQYAFFNGSLQYSAVGNGDHHAFVSLLLAGMLLLLVETLSGERPARARAGWGFGLPAGVLAGLLLGSWVGGLMYVILVQATLAWLLFLHARRPLPAVPAFGLAFHLAALVALLPAILTSPWTEAQPWMVVNLSWFHAAQLAAGALVFAPLFALSAGGAAFRRYPWLVSAALAGLAALLFARDLGPARGIREGFDWAGRSNAFMAYIYESQPLLRSWTRGWPDLFEYLGHGALLLPPILAWIAWRVLRRSELPLLPILVAVPVLAWQALVQRRFSDALAAPMAIAVGWGIASWLACESRAPWARPAGWLRRLPAAVLVLLALAGAGLANLAVAGPMARRVAALEVGALWQPFRRGPDARLRRGQRLAIEWLRGQGPAPLEESVLAAWDLGHTIEWAAHRPTVATNFGIYVGEESYLDPWRFSLAENPAEAEALLERRRVRHVLISCRDTKVLPTMVRLLRPGQGSQYLSNAPGEGPATRDRWYRTFGARLLHQGYEIDPALQREKGDCIDFLRLVYLSPIYVPEIEVPYGPGPFPAAAVWERVPGATLLARGEPGETLQVEIDLEIDHPEITFSPRPNKSISCSQVGPNSTTTGTRRAMATCRASVSPVTTASH